MDPQNKAFTYQIANDCPDQSMLSKLKKQISDAPEPDAAVETRPGEEQPGRRVIQMRVGGQLMSCVLDVMELTINDWPNIHCRVAYVVPITSSIIQFMRDQCGGQLPELVEAVHGWVSGGLGEDHRLLERVL